MLIAGIMQAMNVKVLLTVINVVKKYLALYSSGQAKLYVTGEYALPAIRKQIPPKSSLYIIDLTLSL